MSWNHSSAIREIIPSRDSVTFRNALHQIKFDVKMDRICLFEGQEHGKYQVDNIVAPEQAWAR